MTPHPRAAFLLGAIAVAAVFVPPLVAAGAALVVVTAVVVDALLSRRPPAARRAVPTLVFRGVETPFSLTLAAPTAGRARLRQPLPPDVGLEPSEADDEIRGTLVARRRGSHVLPAAAVRLDGPLGLGRSFHRVLDDVALTVYPDMPTAFRLALTVRQGRYRDAGVHTRGPLGLGTEFESVRDYLPDDDIRQVNWRATARLARPMSNQFRVEQDRDVICVVDCGRLMGAPLGDRTRLDAAIDAVAAVAAVADEVGDRCGVIAFDAEVLRDVPPRRKGAQAVVRAIYDLEPSTADSNYERAFHAIGALKRAFVLVFTDLLEEAAARPLVDAMPVLSRTHMVSVASVADPDLHEMLTTEPAAPFQAYAAAVAVDVLAARARVAARLHGAGADVLEADPHRLAAACVSAYLRAKTRARL